MNDSHDTMGRETYTPGYGRTATNFMAARTFDTHGTFFAPYLEPGLQILDCGCGPGTMTIGLAEAVFPGRATGIDFNHEQIRRAEQMAWGLEMVNLRFVTTGVYEMPFADGSFDRIFSHALLEHLSRPVEALLEMRRLLRPGGIIGVCSPDWDAFDLHPYSRPVRRAIDRYRALQERSGGHTRAGAELGHWLEEAEFTVIDAGCRFEIYESTSRIAEYLAQQLVQDGAHEEAEDLRLWAAEPHACFAQAWGSTVAEA